MKSFFEAFHAPVRFKLSQAASARTLSFHIYPVVLLLVIALLFVSISVSIITVMASDKQALSSQLRQIHELQQKQSRLLHENTEKQALLSLRDAHIDAMKQELERLQLEKTAMQKRLDMFDEVLAARKMDGLHMLRPAAFWKRSDQISYNLILVKGQNFPRWQKGELSFSVMTPDDQELPLENMKGRTTYKFDMTTQEFVSGSLKWTEPWRPENLIITINDLTHRRTSQFSIPILSHAMARPAASGAVK